jgi:hypothetical protein
MSLCLSTVTYKNHKTVPVTGIILSRNLNKTLDLNKNLVLYIQFNLVDKSFADVLAELFFIFFILLEIAKTQVFFKCLLF